jgi:integrase
MNAMGAKKSSRRKPRPLVIKRGSSSVTIYEGHRTVDGRSYPLYTLAYYQPDGSRVRRNFSALEKARAEGELAAARLSRGEINILSLKGSDRAQYLHAVESLKPVGVSLSMAVDDFVSAKLKLPQGVSLLAAVEAYAKRLAIVPRSVAEVVALLLEEKRSVGCSEVHLRDLTSRLGHFAKAFTGSISSVTAINVREFLGCLAKENGDRVSNRTRKNYQRLITGLYHFARRQKFVHREVVEEICELETPKTEKVETGIYTSKQMQCLLDGAPKDLRPVIAIGAFCGLRTAELQRLDWPDIKFDGKVIVVGADKAKTASRRVVPIPDNCLAWITVYCGREGKVSPAQHDRALNTRLTAFSKKLGIEWVRNGLRHSFCSYRLSVTHDPARVALEAGNSPTMIHTHYKALVTEQEGKAWFAVLPASPSL